MANDIYKNPLGQSDSEPVNQNSGAGPYTAGRLDSQNVAVYNPGPAQHPVTGAPLDWGSEGQRDWYAGVTPETRAEETRRQRESYDIRIKNMREMGIPPKYDSKDVEGPVAAHEIRSGQPWNLPSTNEEGRRRANTSVDMMRAEARAMPYRPDPAPEPPPQPDESRLGMFSRMMLGRPKQFVGWDGKPNTGGAEGSMLRPQTDAKYSNPLSQNSAAPGGQGSATTLAWQHEATQDMMNVRPGAPDFSQYASSRDNMRRAAGAQAEAQKANLEGVMQLAKGTVLPGYGGFIADGERVIDDQWNSRR